MYSTISLTITFEFFSGGIFLLMVNLPLEFLSDKLFEIFLLMVNIPLEFFSDKLFEIYSLGITKSISEDIVLLGLKFFSIKILLSICLLEGPYNLSKL